MSEEQSRVKSPADQIHTEELSLAFACMVEIVEAYVDAMTERFDQDSIVFLGNPMVRQMGQDINRICDLLYEKIGLIEVIYSEPCGRLSERQVSDIVLTRHAKRQEAQS